MSAYVPDANTARADLCRFLSACYYEPATEFTEENLFDSLLIAAQELHPDLAERARKLGAAFVAHDLQTLLVDYTRLFLGPMQPLVKPYGSSWLPTAVLTEENLPLAVLDLYSEGGFDIDDEFMDLPDHVAVELEFLYLLNYNWNEALITGAAEKVTATESLKRRFLSEHLGLWVKPFTSAVKSAAETAFYRELAELTQCFVQMEKLRLSVQ